ncbi:hypothetical protein [Kibdelosporangium aridum]|uniref:hypothetical protein n=1 Tax=Kibdelosporangium aridum TaxID=2030 RepID=UPI0035F00956
MGDMSRRAALLGVPAAAAGTVAVSAPGTTELSFTATRSKNTLPLSPPLGAPFIIYLALRNPTGQAIGDGSLTAMVVDLIPDVPPKIVIQLKVIFRLADGEIHASGMQIRQVPEPGKLHQLAITGGTRAYSSARGEGTVEHVTADVSAVTLKVVTD